MIRIGLYSADRKLQPVLSSALGKEFQVLVDSTEDGAGPLFQAGGCDVMILDLDSNSVSKGSNGSNGSNRLNGSNGPGGSHPSNGPLAKSIDCLQRMIALQIPTVVMADDGLRSTAIDLVRQGAFNYCRKPPSVRDLKAMLRRAHENLSLKRQLETVQQRLEATSTCDQMIGSSLQMRQTYDLIRRVADLSASVLVTGESGTGKELIARAIHNLGARTSRPFVAVCCGAIPETLIEAELFGHEKGAFTGTVGAREGYLERAGDGTLFLDEIGELSQSTQVKLLRVLQQREFSRLGSSRLIPLRARLIFATHQDLAEMVNQGRFRHDLYYRINVMRIDAPPLQEHPEDISQLAMHFLRNYSDLYQKPVAGIHPDAMALLQAYSWPGNVRELENVIQRAIIVACGESIVQEDLPRNIQEESVVNIDDYHPAGSFERQLRDYKVKLAMTAVEDNNGNKTLAARSLCISRAYLHRLIRLAETGAPAEPEHEELGTA